MNGDPVSYFYRVRWLPTPKSAIDRLAEQFSGAAREEIRRDEVTGQPYRANLAVTLYQPGGGQMVLWTDIDEAPRKIAHKSFIQRREQMVGDAVQLTFDVTRRNRMHTDEAPINMPIDFAPDVEWRIDGEDSQEDVA